MTAKMTVADYKLIRLVVILQLYLSLLSGFLHFDNSYIFLNKFLLTFFCDYRTRTASSLFDIFAFIVL